MRSARLDRFSRDRDEARPAPSKRISGQKRCTLITVRFGQEVFCRHLSPPTSIEATRQLIWDEMIALFLVLLIGHSSGNAQVEGAIIVHLLPKRKTIASIGWSGGSARARAQGARHTPKPA